MIDVSVVVPVYNEVESVELLVQKLTDALSHLGRSWETVLVDDGSSDGTWPKLKELAGRFKGLRLVRLRRNFGQTAAMSAGFDHARGRIIVTLDADLQNDPEDIPRLIDELEKNDLDVVSGWRKDRKDPFVNRRLPSIMANGLISRFTGVRLHDYGCTLKAYRREVVQNLSLYGEMHRFIPALASWVGGTIGEVPVRHHPRRFGKSKYGISRTIRVVLDLITVNFLLRYSTRPIQIFGRIGVYSLLAGLLLMAVMVVPHLIYPFVHPTDSIPASMATVAQMPASLNLPPDTILVQVRPISESGGILSELVSLAKRPFWVTTPFMLIFFGIQFISMGLLAELQTRTYHESQKKPVYTVRDIIES